MGKREVTREYETTTTETVEVEVPATEEETEHVFFCDDCGDPHGREDLMRYYDASPEFDPDAGFDFCDSCISRFEQTQLHTGVREPTLEERVSDSTTGSVLTDWRVYCLGLFALSVVFFAAGDEVATFGLFMAALVLLVDRVVAPWYYRESKAELEGLSESFEKLRQ